MLESLLYLIVYLAVLGIVLWLVIYVTDLLPLPAPFHQIIRVVVYVLAAIAIIYLLLGLIGGAPRLGVTRFGRL